MNGDEATKIVNLILLILFNFLHITINKKTQVKYLFIYNKTIFYLKIFSFKRAIYK